MYSRQEQRDLRAKLLTRSPTLPLKLSKAEKFLSIAFVVLDIDTHGNVIYHEMNRAVLWAFVSRTCPVGGAYGITRRDLFQVQHAWGWVSCD